MALDNKSLLPELEIQVPVSGGHLSVHRYGSNQGKPILAIHGVTSSNRAWQCFAAALVPRGYSIYAVDLRGRGNSNSLAGPFGMKNHALDMKATLDFLGIEKCDVVGHSMGGFVVVAFMSLFPDRVSKATLIDGGIPLPLPPGFTVDQILPMVLGPALARLNMTFASSSEYRDYWKPQAAFAKGWSSVLDEYVDYDLKGDAPHLKPSTNPASVEEDSRDLFGSELIENGLRNLHDDVLLLRAERGLQNEVVPLYPIEMINAALLNYPRVKLRTLDDTNHYDILIHHEGAERCATAIYGEA